MKDIWAALAGLAVLAASSGAWAQNRLFSENTEIQFVLEGPLTTLVRTAPRSTDPYPAAVILPSEQRLEIQLSARGLSRRTRGLCATPPLRLDFGDGLRGTPFQGQNRLKLVTRCRPGSNYQQLVVLEYLAYRLHNEITPFSYRVRPALVTYRDTDGRRREDAQFNYLIEDGDDVARRNRRVELDVMTGEVNSAGLNAEAAARFALFQYMIGNLDWDMVQQRPGEQCCHNTRLLGASANSRSGLMPVPYDFDHSGLVDAPYATPPDSIPVRNVRTRYYRGLCIHNNQLPAAMEAFRSRRAALNAVVANEARLSEARRRTAQRYIDEFFELIDNPARVERDIIQRCRR
jgi:hypothetical protein